MRILRVILEFENGLGDLRVPGDSRAAQATCSPIRGTLSLIQSFSATR